MLPEYLTRRKAVVNVPAPNQLSFHFVLAATLRSGKLHRGQLEYLDIIIRNGWEQIDYPIQVDQLNRLITWTFNSKSDPLVFNIYTIDDTEGKKKRCIYFGNEWDTACIFILYHEGRFYLINNFSRFMSGNKAHRRRCFHCQRCLLRFTSDSKRKTHQESCDYQVIFSSFPIDATAIRDRDHLELPKATSKFNLKTDHNVLEWIEKQEHLTRQDPNRAKKVAAQNDGQSDNWSMTRRTEEDNGSNKNVSKSNPIHQCEEDEGTSEDATSTDIGAAHAALKEVCCDLWEADGDECNKAGSSTHGREHAEFDLQSVEEKTTQPLSLLKLLMDP